MQSRALLRAGAIAAFVLLLPTTGTLAADVPPPAPAIRAPVAVVAPAYSWYGFYIGVQGGYGWGGNAIAYTPLSGYGTLFGSGAVPGPVSDNPSGFAGGITYGSNFQFGRLVIGTESDWSYSDIKKTETLGPRTGFTTRITGEQQINYFSTSRARAGVLVTEQWLLYGTGGLAAGSVEGSTTFNLVAPGVCAGIGNCPIGSRSKTLWGWAAGGGMEFANGPWSVKVEYLHYDLGTLNYSVVDPTFPGGVINASSKFSGHLVRGGLNYRFNWTLLDIVFGSR